jgi:uncharacterized protein YegL
MTIHRTATARAIVPIMRLTNFRFSKDYRHGTTFWHRAIYATVDTVGANIRAGTKTILIPVESNPYRKG